MATLTGRRLTVAFAALMFANAMSAMDATIVSTAAPTITSDLGRLSLLPWITTAYMLAQVGTVGLHGKLGDLLGRKRVFIAAVLVFLGASVLCGLAQTMPQLIAFRTLQGLGAGGVAGLAMATVADIVPPARLGRFLGYAGLVFGVTSVLGPLAGGLFVDHLSWRWAFFINVPIGLLAIAVIHFLVSTPPGTRRQIDVVGAVLLASTTSTLVLFTSWAGVEHDWGSPVIIGLGAMALLSAALFVGRELTVAEPLVPLRVLRERTVALAIAANFVAGTAFMPGIVYLSVTYQAVLGRDATVAGFLLIPLGLSTALSTVVVGRIVERFGGAKVIPAIGMVTMGVAFAALGTLDADSSVTFLAACGALAGLGVGCVMQTMLHVVQRSVPPENLGVSTSSVILGRILGGTLGVAYVGAVFNSRLAREIARVPGIEVSEMKGDSASVAQLTPGVRDAVTDAFADALAAGFRALVPIMVIGLLTVLVQRSSVLARRLAVPAPPTPAPEPV
jgi:EmrB/QacA subfamily drug resistance transporter